jgi:hypothetical protein
MRRFFRSIHRQRAPIAAVPLVGVVLLAERPSTLIVELCLRAAIRVVADQLDRPACGRRPFWTTVGGLGGVVLLLRSGGVSHWMSYRSARPAWPGCAPASRRTSSPLAAFTSAACAARRSPCRPNVSPSYQSVDRAAMMRVEGVHPSSH